MKNNASYCKFKIAIIGAGISGLCMAINLLKAGFKEITIFEQTDDIGGTWRDNTYPGLVCDVPAKLYSFSFEQNPNWSKRFVGQEEILAYLKSCAHKYHIYPLIKFNTAVSEVFFQEEMKLWLLKTNSGKEEYFNIIINAVGQLNIPYTPEIAGQSDFRGTSFHSSRWDHSHNFSKENVAVLGTAASAIQFIPAISTKVDQLYIFQRSPNWIMLSRNPTLSNFNKWLSKRFPIFLKMQRFIIWAFYETRLSFFRNKILNKITIWYVLFFMHRDIKDRSLRHVLTPDYPFGCKRVLRSNNYYPTLTKKNVHLVTSPIHHFTADGITTNDGKHYKVNTVIYGTGFKGAEFLAPMKIYSRNGVDLNKIWDNGIYAYLGATIPTFPNFFILLGPNTFLGHNSVIIMIEYQAAYIIKLIRYLQDNNYAYLDLKEATMAQWRQELGISLDESVWANNCQSWHKDKSGHVVSIWPYSTITYWWRMREINPSDYTFG